MINETYSYRIFTNQSFINEDPSDFSNTIILNSCFYQENSPNKIIFPNNLVNVEFVNCNLDNVLLPDGLIYTNCSNNKIKIQNDGCDWLLDNDLNPVSNLDISAPIQNPVDLPTSYLRSETIPLSDYESLYGVGSSLTQSWYLETPIILNQYNIDAKIETSVELWNLRVSLGYYAPFSGIPTAILLENGNMLVSGQIPMVDIQGPAKKMRDW